jgi:hypothetical protein
MRGKNKQVNAEHVRPYLIHVDTLVVITVQIKAWMDSAGICMWAEVQLGPHFAKLRGKCCIIWDNCGSHNVPAIGEVFAEWGIKFQNLPKKMTDILQVMDLIVNGPVKAAIRRKRVEVIFNYFQSWKIKRLQHEVAAKLDPTKLPPIFSPPKPTQAEGVLTLLNVLSTSLATPAFEESMRKCFVQVGLQKGDDKEYVLYSATRKGFLQQIMPQVKSSDDAISVGEVASELVLSSRPPDGPDGEPLESDEEGGGEEEEEDGEEGE